MSTTSFGERLKRERELRGVSLADIEGATRIKLKYLEALEAENWAALPGGVFNRGFIRTVARYLGMDEDSILAEYTLAQKDLVAAADRFVNLTRQPPWWSHRVTTGAILAICLAAIVAIGWLGYRGAAGAWRSAASHSTARAKPTVSASPARAPAPAPVPVEAGIAPIPSSKLERNASASVEPGYAPATATKQFLQMKVEAGKNARIRVAADRRLLFNGRISAGETRRYRARNTFEIFSSDSGAVLIELEGQTMPPLGPSGQPGGATFTRRDLAAAAGGTH